MRIRLSFLLPHFPKFSSLLFFFQDESLLEARDEMMFTMSPFSSITNWRISMFWQTTAPGILFNLVLSTRYETWFTVPSHFPTSLSLNPEGPISAQSAGLTRCIASVTSYFQTFSPLHALHSFLDVKTRDAHSSSSSKISIHKCTDYSQCSVFMLDLPNVSTGKPNGYAKKTDLR